MSADEFRIWLQYRRKWGPLNPMQRLDAAVARMAVWKYGKRVEDYMPWPAEEMSAKTGEELLEMVKRIPAARKK
jgi:hypothetical protein